MNLSNKKVDIAKTIIKKKFMIYDRHSLIKKLEVNLGHFIRIQKKINFIPTYLKYWMIININY